MASEALKRLSGVSLSARRIRRQVDQVGTVRVAQREAAVEQLKSRSLPERRRGNLLQAAPDLAVVMMDGGRYQRRDNFGNPGGSTGETACSHWRESKVGCLLTMDSTISDEDPCKNIPPEYACASAVREIAKIAENTSVVEQDCDEAKQNVCTSNYSPPTLLSKEVVASGQSAEQFGWHLESKAFALNFPSARRSAFVADGLRANWCIQEKHFPHCVPIADIMHVLSYAWSAAQASQGNDAYPRWAQWIWQGDVQKVIEELRLLNQQFGPPDRETPPTDPSYRIQRALTYFVNNAPHMNYAQYRRQGLPLTSAHIESTIKQINRRIKGSEKFWKQSMSETILQLRADSISDSCPLEQFWLS